MTRLLESKGKKDIPLIVDSMGSDAVYFEIRAFSEDGHRAGVLYTIIDKEDARILAYNLNQWLDKKRYASDYIKKP